jgi:hypothetical protein
MDALEDRSWIIYQETEREENNFSAGHLHDVICGNHGSCGINRPENSDGG